MPSRSVKKNPAGYPLQYEPLDDPTTGIDPDDPVRLLEWRRSTRVYHTVEYALATFYVSIYGSGCFYKVLSSFLKQGRDIEEAIPSLSWFLIGTSLGYIWVEPSARNLGIRFPTLGFLLMLYGPRHFIDYMTPTWVCIPELFYGIMAAGPLACGARGMAQFWPSKYRPAIAGIHSFLMVLGSLLAPIIGSAAAHTKQPHVVPFAFIVLLIGIRSGVPINQHIYGTGLYEVYARVGKYTTGNWSVAAYRLGNGWLECYRTFFLRFIDTLKTPATSMLLGSLGFAYGILYLAVARVGTDFKNVHSFDPVFEHMPLLSIVVGYATGLVCCTRYFYQYSPPNIEKKTKCQRPESQLWPMMLLGWTLPAGCLMYACTINRGTHWVIPTMALYLIGVGIGVVFQTCANYFEKMYSTYSLSLLASSTFMNGIFGGVFTLIAAAVTRYLGISGVWSLAGRASLLVAAVPFILYQYGASAKTLEIGPEMDVSAERLAGYLIVI